MKAIRRSIKGEKQDTRPLHNSITPKSAIAIQAPKRVIKALYDYNPDPQNTQELGFAKGDFFHVISRENDPNWYEACNPLIPSARGLVPVSYFENIGKTERQSGGSTASSVSNTIPLHDSGYAEKTTHGRQDSISNTRRSGHQRMPSMGKGSGAMVYGIVQYDFNAERPDELEAKQGEAIIVIAQSNPEWFVAKPIGRLGGPGLIPVSFIEIRDMSTGQAVPDAQAAVARAGVPKVEEWKKMAADYKNSSITLGKFEATNAGSMQKDLERMSLNNGNHSYGHTNGTSHQMQHQGGYGGHQRQASRNTQNGYYHQPQRRLLAPVSASIPRYIFENDKYWYIIECEMEDGSHWELSRIYQKFYDFQIALLQQFQKESITPAGGGKRILPFMPGPVTYVTDAISNGRRESLNQYVHELLDLPPYISRCELVRELFAPREGDHELDPDRVTEDYRHSSGSQQSSFAGSLSRPASRQSSRGQMNGTNGYGSMGPPQHKITHQRSQGSTNGAVQAQQYRNQPEYQYQNAIKPQASTITQASSNSSAPNNSSTNVSGALKIKVNFQDDLIAIRVPSEIGFQQLKDKLMDRLKVQDEILIKYKDESTNDYIDMLSDRDLDMALSRNQKLTLYVGFA